MKLQVTSLRSEVRDTELFAKIQFEGIISVDEFNMILNTFESYRHEGNTYRIKRDEKYILIERVDK